MTDRVHDAQHMGQDPDEAAYLERREIDASDAAIIPEANKAWRDGYETGFAEGASSKREAKLSPYSKEAVLKREAEARAGFGPRNRAADSHAYREDTYDKGRCWICGAREDQHAIPNVVRESKHPYRLTWTKMARLDIPPEQPVGLNRNARGHRRRWHILEDGEPLCERVTSADLGQIRPWGDVRDERACDRCHHEFSWTPLPHDTEERDLGYETPCWIWTRGLDDDGYGQYGRKGQHLGTHRAAYIAEYGEPPEGYVVHHLCGQAACLRPDHLQAMPRSEHIRLHRPELAPGSAALKRKP